MTRRPTRWSRTPSSARIWAPATEEQAANDVVITFQTTVLPGATEVTNQALAHWDATDTGSVDDDISAGQIPVETGRRLGRTIPPW